MDKEKLEEDCLVFCKKHPSLKKEVLDLYQLALDEIEQGESEEHECELAWEAINQLLSTENE